MQENATSQITELGGKIGESVEKIYNLISGFIINKTLNSSNLLNKKKKSKIYTFEDLKSFAKSKIEDFYKLAKAIIIKLLKLNLINKEDAEPLDFIKKTYGYTS